jgi:energy-coupling factor transporter ATP-binding protein EcfA2
MGVFQSRDPSGEYRPVPITDGGIRGRTSAVWKSGAQAEEDDKDLGQLVAEEDQDVPSVIQFSCAVYFCEEAEGMMQVDVVRLGTAHGEAYVEWRTEDSSAKAGVKYQAASGSLHFLPGETMKEVIILLLNDDAWDATLEFAVLLSNCRGAQLGKYLSHCRVKIIDDDVFPTNRYDELLRNGQEAAIPGFGLMWQYIKMNMKNAAIRNDSVKQVVIDQSKGLYFILCLYLMMYLVDVVLNPPDQSSQSSRQDQQDDGVAVVEDEMSRRLLKRGIESGAVFLARALGTSKDDDPPLPVQTLLVPGHRRETAMVIGALWIVPFGILHLIDLWKCYLRIPGLARKTLQANLLRRFLHYREDMRAKMGMMDTSEITMAMVRDVHEVVDFGFMKVLEVLRILGKLVCASVFILAENPTAVVPLVVYPVCLLTFLCCREKKTITHNDRKAAGQDRVVQAVNDATHNYRIIADFHLRPLIVDTYEQRIEDYHEQESILCAIITNNSYLAPWLTTLSIGLYIVVGSYEVSTLGGPLSLGAFLATIHVFKDVGSEMQEIYGECLEIQRAFGPLRKICHFMNFETDLPQRLKINRMRRQQGEDKRQHLRLNAQTAGAEAFAVDQVQIEVQNLSFQYCASAPPVLLGININFDQGKMYAFIGPPHEGKATLLRLLGQVLLPQDGGGSIFVPPHLRVLHVATQSTVLAHSLLRNIVLDQDLKKVGGPERILRICRLLGFSPFLMKTLLENLGVDDQPLEVTTETPIADVYNGANPAVVAEKREPSWTACLSDTDHARLTLARVFVMNPECVVYHKPVLMFNEVEAEHMLKAIRTHTEERGVDLPVRGRRFRRPRTVFFTSSTIAGIRTADQVYKVSTEGIWPIAKDQVDARLLS